MSKIKLNYIDLGVHRGEEIDIVLRDYEKFKDIFELKIFGIEADIDWYLQLEHRYEDWSEVNIYNNAISDINAEVKLFLDPGRLGSSIFKTKRNVNKDNYTLVQGITMVDFIKNNIPDFKKSVNVLKLNIEGAELLVYRDLINSNMLQYIDLFCGHPSHDIEKVPELLPSKAEYYQTLKDHGIDIKYLCGEVHPEKSINIFKNI